MKLNDFYFLLLGAFSGSFIALAGVSSMVRKDSDKTTRDPLYIMVPNAGESSRKAGDDYLRIIQSQGERAETPVISRFRSLYELSKVPVWSFSNAEFGLYLRNGTINGEPDSWWNWSIILGDAATMGRELPKISKTLCEADPSSKESLRVAVVGALRTGSRLMAGTPTLITGLIGMFWGEMGAEALGVCPSLLEDEEVRTAVKEFSELCTVEPGIEWEMVVFPRLVEGYSPSLSEYSAGELRERAGRLKSKLLIFLEQ